LLYLQRKANGNGIYTCSVKPMELDWWESLHEIPLCMRKIEIISFETKIDLQEKN